MSDISSFGYGVVSDQPSGSTRDISLLEPMEDESSEIVEDIRPREDSFSEASSAILNRVLQRESSTREADPTGRIFRLVLTNIVKIIYNFLKFA